MAFLAFQHFVHLMFETSSNPIPRRGTREPKVSDLQSSAWREMLLHPDIATAILTNVTWAFSVAVLHPNKHAFTAKAVWADFWVLRTTRKHVETETFGPNDIHVAHRQHLKWWRRRRFGKGPWPLRSNVQAQATGVDPPSSESFVAAMSEMEALGAMNSKCSISCQHFSTWHCEIPELYILMTEVLPNRMPEFCSLCKPKHHSEAISLKSKMKTRAANTNSSIQSGNLWTSKRRMLHSNDSMTMTMLWVVRLENAQLSRMSKTFEEMGPSFTLLSMACHRSMTLLAKGFSRFFMPLEVFKPRYHCFLQPLRAVSSSAFQKSTDQSLHLPAPGPISCHDVWDTFGSTNALVWYARTPLEVSIVRHPIPWIARIVYAVWKLHCCYCIYTLIPDAIFI